MRRTRALLRARRERPLHCRAAEQRDEVAPDGNAWITSRDPRAKYTGGWARSVGYGERPRLAVKLRMPRRGCRSSAL
jgi:hypothetical protein